MSRKESAGIERRSINTRKVETKTSQEIEQKRKGRGKAWDGMSKTTVKWRQFRGFWKDFRVVEVKERRLEWLREMCWRYSNIGTVIEEWKWFGNWTLSWVLNGAKKDKQQTARKRTSICKGWEREKGKGKRVMSDRHSIQLVICESRMERTKHFLNWYKCFYESESRTNYKLSKRW